MMAMRFPAVAAALLALPLGAASQPLDEISPEGLWTRFLQTCSTVLTDPDAYLAGLPRPGPSGERVISVSPDRNVVSVFHRIGNAYDEVELYRVGNHQIRDCAVIGEYYDMETGGAQMETAVLAQGLTEIAASVEGVTLTGGHAPQDYSEENTFYTVDEIYLFAIDGLWPETGEVAVVHVIGGELQFMVQFVVTP
jgi:hypothetical protein